MNRLRSAVLVFAVGSIASLAPAAFAHSHRTSAQAPSASTPAGATSAGAAERLSLDGIENLGRVSQFLYRGAQPKDFAYRELKSAGVSVVVDFRDEQDEIAHEKKVVEGLGMQFLSLPWSARSGASHDLVLSFLNLVRDNPDKKIFVHCREGRDRTGMMVALYRITFDHWNADQAIQEMKDFHYHSFLLPHLARYVRDYPTLLASDPALTGIAAATRVAVQP